MIYLIGWLLIYYYLIVRFLVQHRVRLLAVVVVLLLGGLAIFRGAVGTDTVAYEKLVFDSERMAGIEPGFWLLISILKGVIPDPVFVIRGLAFIFTILIWWFIWKADDDELFFIMSFIFPLFFYAFSMNVLRMGLASAIFLIALQLDRRDQKHKAILMAFVSVLFHYSMIFTILYMWLSNEQIVGKYKIYGIFFIIVIVLIFMALNEIYFVIKIQNYAVTEPPGMLSGLSRVILCVILLIGIWFSSLPRVEVYRLLLWTLLFMGIFWGITRISYAGLRMLDLLVFSLSIAIMRSYNRAAKPVDRSVKLSWLLAGLIGAVGVYRNMLQETFWSSSPWLPYHTVFDR